MGRLPEKDPQAALPWQNGARGPRASMHDSPPESRDSQPRTHPHRVVPTFTNLPSPKQTKRAASTGSVYVSAVRHQPDLREHAC